MVIFNFIIISFFIKLTTSNENNESIYLYKLSETNNYDFSMCLTNFLTKKSKENTINLLLSIKYDTKNAEAIFKSVLGTNFIYDEIKKANLTFLLNLAYELFNANSTFTSDLFQFIEDNGIAIDYIINIINATQFSLGDALGNITKILNLKGADKIFMPIIKSKYNDALFKLVEILLLPKSGYKKVYYYFKNIFYENKDIVIPYLYDAIKYLDNGDIFMNCTEAFLVNATKTGFIDELKSLLMNQTISNDISDAINLTNYNGRVIKNELFKRPEIICGFLDLIYNRTIFELLFQIFRHLKSKEYIQYKLPKMLSLIYDYKPKLAKDILDVTAVILQQLITQKEVTNFITMGFTKYLNDSFFYEKFKYYNIGDDCYDAMYTIFFKNVERFYSFDQEMDYEEAIKPLKEMRSFFLKKVIIDSTKDKNDFLTYENCLEKKYDDTTLKNFRFNFTFQPIYIIAMFDDLDNKTTLYDSILIEKYNYWLGYCLPYGKFNNQSTEICSQNDYSNILRIFMEIPFDMRTAKVNSFMMNESKFTVEEYLMGLLYIIIMLIPLIIKLFLYIYSKISYNSYKKRQMNNKIMLIPDDQSNTKKDELVLQNDEKFELKIVKPKWFEYLNEYFDIIKNGEELFNFNIKKTNINNVNGITYIKGLLGISMILYIFGQTFLILFNLPFKTFTLTVFNDSVKNPIYVISLIGLRYSPRVILSCSGYTLIYKYLNFIDQEQSYYFPKFVLIQSYKYILLLYVVLFMRYAFYYIHALICSEKRPMLEILNYNLNANNSNYFVYFFELLLAYRGDYKFENKMNIIQYFYVPLNEIFCFIFGIIFFSIGYKCKWRNDIIIIIIILLIFIAKILLVLLYMDKNKKYPTLFFYLYDYAAIMLNPIFNLPSFLIGIFFGLINYTIQKGICLYANESYSRILTFENEQPSFSINDPESNNEDNLERKITVDIGHKKMELDNLNKKSNIYENDDQENIRSHSHIIPKNPNSKNKRKSKKILFDKNFTEKSTLIDNELSSQNKDEYDDKIKEMPFLILPSKVLNFHQQNEGKFYFKIIIFSLVLFIISFSCAQFVYVGIFSIINDTKDEEKEILEKLSFQKVITNFSLNLIYTIDIDLVVIMINWGFFIIYSNGLKTADIFDFFNHSIWTFFIKCYYSFIIISTPVILCIFYFSETVIKFNIINVLLFSFINMIIIFLIVIVFYSIYEIPLKKIFKSFLVKRRILNDELDEDNNYDYSLDEKRKTKIKE